MLTQIGVWYFVGKAISANAVAWVHWIVGDI